MLIEAVVPLGGTEPGVAETPSRVLRGTLGADGRRLEQWGFDGLAAEETKDSPFTVLAFAAEATERIRLATSVAIAFARSPAITAMDAWTLQRVSGGRFTLGLGSQVRRHVERRYGMPWSAPAPRMREYVLAVRALWSCWQDGTRPGFAGEHYRADLMVPLFDPGPLADPVIPVHLAAVNPVMCRVAGEVADGIRFHPVCTASYISDVLLPEAERGAARAGRTPAGGAVAVGVKPLIGYAADRAGLERAREELRGRLAFYASTAAYRPAFAHHGDEAIADKARGLVREGRWAELPDLVSDEVLDRYAFAGSPERVGARLRDRFGTLADRLEVPVPEDDGAHRLVPRLLDAVRGA